MGNTMNKIAETLVFCNRFANKRVSAEDIGLKSHNEWVNSVNALRKACYNVAEICENSGLKVEDNSIDKSAAFAALRSVLALVGDVNGRKLFANERAMIMLVGYSARRANNDSAELQFAASQLRNAKAALVAAEKTPNGKEAFIASMTKQVVEYQTAVDALLAEPDNRHKMVTRVAENAFRLDCEHLIARAITDQAAKSADELDAEEAERKARRAAAAKARKNGKK